MPYGTIKVDNITFTDNSVDKTVSLSGLIQNPTFTGNVTVTGTVSGDVIRGGTTISGATITGTTVSTTTGSFVSLTGTTATFTSGIIASGTAALPSLAILSDPNTGLFSPGADQLAISTNGTGRLFVDASGNVNIDSYTLYVDAANNRVGVGNPSPGALLHAAGKIRFGSNTSFYGEIDHDAASTGANIYNHSDSGGHIFQNAGTTQLSIDGSGRLLVGIIASPANQLQVSTDSAGKPSTSTWTIVSDERIKEDIELADLDLCYEAIKAIPLKRYKWRDEIYTAEQVTDRRKLGWIAQDVETVFPKAVGTHEFKYNQVFEETIIPAVEEELDADGNVITRAQPERTEQGDLISEDVIEDCRNLNSDQIYAAMYGAVQKLMAKVETLEASNADMLARLSALEAA